MVVRLEIVWSRINVRSLSILCPPLPVLLPYSPHGLNPALLRLANAGLHRFKGSCEQSIVSFSLGWLEASMAQVHENAKIEIKGRL